MIKFHFDSDFDALTYGAVLTPAGDILFIVNPSRIGVLDDWVRETLANEVTRMAMQPPTPSNVVYLSDLRKWADAVSACHASTSTAVATDR